MNNILNYIVTIVYYIVNFLKNIFNKVLRKDGGDNLNKNEISEVNKKNIEDNKFSKNKFIESDATFNDNSQNSNNSNNVINSNNHNVVNNTYNMTVNNFNINNDMVEESSNNKNDEENIKYIFFELCDDIQIKKVVFPETTQIIIVIHTHSKVII